MSSATTMSLRRIGTLAWKDLRQLRRDRLFAPFIVLGPVLELVAVAYSTSAGITSLPTAVVDLDNSATSRAFVTKMENTDTFVLRERLESPSELPALLDRGAVTVGLVVPDGFGAALSDPLLTPPQIQVLVDGSEPAAAETAIGALEGLAQHFGARARYGESAVDDLVLPIEPVVRVRFNEELKESNYTVPSEMGYMLAAVTVMLASLGIARERELGTLEQLMVSPLKPFELVIGKAIPAILISYLVFLLMLIISIVGFDVPMRGSWALLLGLAAMYLFVELGFGVMASAVSATQLQALLLVFVFVMIEVVFSGYAFPVENMPAALQFVANLFPIKHWLIVFRSIMLKGAGPAAYWQELLALVVLGVAVMSATVWLLRRQRLE